jgi:O-antigen/teichoic acid export membrane protein
VIPETEDKVGAGVGGGAGSKSGPSRRGILRHALPMVQGTAFGQGLLVLVSPILTRIYTPEDMGVLAVFSAFLSILAIVATLRYEDAIPAVADEDEAEGLFRLSVRVALVLSGIVLGVLMALATTTSIDFPREMWLLPVGMAGAGIYAAHGGIAVRAQDYRLLGRTSLFKSLWQVGIQLSLPLVHPGPLGLILGRLADRLSGIGLLRRSLGAKGLIRGAGRGWGMLTLARRHGQYGIYGAPSALVQVGGTQLMPLLVVHHYGLAAGGLFALANRVLVSPLSVLGTSLGQAYLGQASLALRSQASGVLSLFQETSVRLLAIALVLAILAVPAFLFGFGPVFGGEWEVAGLMALGLLPMFMANLILSPLEKTYNLISRQRVKLLMDGMGLLVTVLAISVAAVVGQSVVFAVAFVGILRALVMILNWAVLRHLLRESRHAE